MSEHSYYERRHREQMKNPVYRRAYKQARHRMEWRTYKRMRRRMEWRTFWRGFFGFFYPPLLGKYPHFFTRAFWKRERRP